MVLAKHIVSEYAECHAHLNRLIKSTYLRLKRKGLPSELNSLLLPATHVIVGYYLQKKGSATYLESGTIKQAKSTGGFRPNRGDNDNLTGTTNKI
ncbi:hypothetical protein GCM10027566_22120 [Arachidicoccus ginsenosidivorans]